MKYSAVIPALVLFSSNCCSAFSPRLHCSARISNAVTSGDNVARLMVSTSEEEPKKKKLTSVDILNKARIAIGEDPIVEDEQLFSDELLVDFQESLLKIEKRVSGGPGSLSAEEVSQFEAATTRIMIDMDSKLDGSVSKIISIPESIQMESSQSANISLSESGVTRAPVDVFNPFLASKDGENPSTPDVPTIVDETIASSTEGVALDNSDDESPAYDGKSGMGLAKGTRNTYMIPGMDEMSPEEYQAALQRSVSDRQSKRRNAVGSVGSQAANHYLDGL